MDFKGVVHIRNEICHVFGTARQVLMAAQNASLMAHRAGRAQGFHAVVNELKGFSHSLEMGMERIQENMQGVVAHVAFAYREARYVHLHERTQGMLGSDDTSMVMVLARKRLQEHEKQLSERIGNLKRQIAQSVRLCNNGRVLACSARIESVADEEHEAKLSTVAHEIESVIEDIYARLKSITTWLANREAKR